RGRRRSRDDHCRRRRGDALEAAHNAREAAPSAVGRIPPRMLKNKFFWGGESMLVPIKRKALAAIAFAAAATFAFVSGAAAQSKEPIKIGFSMAQTGGLGPNGKSALLAEKIWEEDVNAKGGLLGRPVKLIYYDDQTQPATVPGIYTKLLDVDKVDIVMGGYGTNMLAPAMPVVMQ